jgi:hypothetical protein
MRLRNRNLFIATLPSHYEALHWRLAGSAIVAAARQHNDAETLETATDAMENALATDGMLVRYSPELRGGHG